jgi:hypothetical protein
MTDLAARVMPAPAPPTPAALAALVGALDSLPPDDPPAAIETLEGALARCWARLRLAGRSANGEGAERLLMLDQAAECSR